MTYSSFILSAKRRSSSNFLSVYSNINRSISLLRLSTLRLSWLILFSILFFINTWSSCNLYVKTHSDTNFASIAHFPQSWVDWDFDTPSITTMTLFFKSLCPWHRLETGRPPTPTTNNSTAPPILKWRLSAPRFRSSWSPSTYLCAAFRHRKPHSGRHCPLVIVSFPHTPKHITFGVVLPLLSISCYIQIRGKYYSL